MISRIAHSVFVVLLLTLFGLVAMGQPVRAAVVATSVTVGNSAPAFTVAPAENPVSDTVTPTWAGNDVTFEATATDNNGDAYYLIVCQTNSATATNGGAPTCGGGTWCVSGSTTSGSQASCAHTTSAGSNETNAWFAFVCDGVAAGAACSSSSQGSGDSGSPFVVNHAPVFTNIANNSPQNPGGTITWTATASDTNTGATVTLLVCKVAGVSGTDCTGGVSDRWCVSDPAASNPSCDYEIPIPTAAGANNAYVYIFDNHGMPSTSGTQGSASNYSVNNVAPVISSVTLNGGLDINLTENTTTPIILTATVTDNNSCTDIASVEANLYRSGIGAGLCNAGGHTNGNNCYPVITCSVVTEGNTCGGAGDASAGYTCTVNVQYFADPTDAATLYSAENWLNTIVAVDDGALSDDVEVSSGVQMLSLVGMDVAESIEYGAMSAGQVTDPLSIPMTVTATGNVGLNTELSGTDLESGEELIVVGYQRYALTASVAYASGVELTDLLVEAALQVPKTTSVTAASKPVYWGIEIPSLVVPGAYNGVNTVLAVKGDPSDW
jgi:hypothetical protein